MKNRAPRIMEAFYSTPWVLLPEKLFEVEAMLRRAAMADPALAFISATDGAFDCSLSVRSTERGLHAAGVTDEQRAEWQAAATAARQRSEKARGTSIAVIPVFGVISRRANMMSASGGTSIEGLTAAFRTAMADEKIGTIILDIDSPGGSVYGMEELAAEIFAARSQKKIIAVADHMAASGGYYLGSQASQFIAAPGSRVGSIGVISIHVDESRALDRAGVTVSMITSGKNKAEGNPFEPLGEEFRAVMQKAVDEYGQMFIKAVARGRSVSMKAVNDNFGQGRMFSAADALGLGMVDRISTLDAALSRLGVRSESSGPQAKVVPCPACEGTGMPGGSKEDCPACHGMAFIVPEESSAPSATQESGADLAAEAAAATAQLQAQHENARARARLLQIS